MLAFFHCDGTFPWSSEAWNSKVTAGAISTAVCFRSMVGIPSGPEVMQGLRFFNSLMTPFSFTVMFSMGGWWLSPRSGSGVPLSVEKTDTPIYKAYTNPLLHQLETHHHQTHKIGTINIPAPTCADDMAIIAQ